MLKPRAGKGGAKGPAGFGDFGMDEGHSKKGSHPGIGMTGAYGPSPTKGKGKKGDGKKGKDPYGSKGGGDSWGKGGGDSWGEESWEDDWGMGDMYGMMMDLMGAYGKDPWSKGGKDKDPYGKGGKGKDPYGKGGKDKDPYGKGGYGMDAYAFDPYSMGAYGGGKGAYGGGGLSKGNPYAAYGSYGGKGGKKGKPEPEYEPASTSAPPTRWLKLPEGSGITSEGLQAEAPVVTHEKGHDVFSSAAHILYDLCGDADSSVEIIHDQDWKQFPEVAAAAKAAGCEENCIAVAFCKARGKWGVGMAGGWKPRESAAKLALCVALAVDHPQLSGVCRNHPDFGTLMRLQGAGEAVGGPAPGKRGSKKRGGGMPDGGLPTVHWVNLTEESQLTAQGLPAGAPAIMWEKGMSVFSESSKVLRSIVGSIDDEVKFQHDADWTEFPEVGAALKASVPGEDQCFCVASSATHGKWALGLATGWKGREVAAKLALAVAICSEGGVTLDTLAAQYSDFGALCASAGMEINEPTPEALAEAEERRPPKKTKTEASEEKEVGLGESEAGAKEPSLPKDSPFWLRLSAAPAILIDGMPSETIMMSCGEDGSRKSLYSHVKSALSCFVESTDVEYVDDANWDAFPEIAKALEGYNIANECLGVAVCGSSGIWAAGTGRKAKTRQQAAELALATVLALRAAKSGDTPDLAGLDEFQKLVEEAAATS